MSADFCIQVHKLLGQFESQTGEQFKGNDSQYEKLEQMAYEASGSKIPLPILKKMYVPSFEMLLASELSGTA